MVKEGTQKQMEKTHWLCSVCGADFWGAKKSPKCPQCGAEGLSLTELNVDGLPLEDVKTAVRGGVVSQSLPNGSVLISAQRGKGSAVGADLARDAITRADELNSDLFFRDMNQTIQDSYLSRVKAHALESQISLLERQKKLNALTTEEEGGQEQPQNMFMTSTDPTSLIKMLNDLPEEQREWWLDNPARIRAVATILNPPEQTIRAYEYAGNPLAQFQALLAQSQGGGGNQVMGSIKKEESSASSMADFAEAMKFMVQTFREMMPEQKTGVDPAVLESIRDIKSGMDDLKNRYQELQLDIVTKSIEGKDEGVTRQEIADLIRNEMKGNARTPAQEVESIQKLVEGVDKLRATMKGEPIPGQIEPLDEWIKKHTFEREIEDRKMMHEEKMKKQESEIERWRLTNNLFKGGIMAEQERRKQSKGYEEISSKEEAEEERARKTRVIIS